MGILGNISGKDAVKAFKKAGWKEIGQVGSHLMMSKDGVRANLLFYKYGIGTVRKLFRVVFIISG